MKNVILVCTDVFGLEILSIIQNINAHSEVSGKGQTYHVLGYISETAGLFDSLFPSIAYLGSIQKWTPVGDETYIMGMKIPAEKKKAAGLLMQRGCRFETVCAPWTLGLPTEIGEGSIFAAFSVKPGMKVGRFVTVVEAMLTQYPIGDYSTIMRFANITGEVGKCTYIGNHVYTHLGKCIGDDCYIADGGIAVRDVKSGVAVAGVPARKKT